MHYSCQGGFYVVNMVDTYVGGFPLLFVGLFECLVLQYVYGKLHRIYICKQFNQIKPIAVFLSPFLALEQVNKC